MLPVNHPICCMLDPVVVHIAVLIHVRCRSLVATHELHFWESKSEEERNKGQCLQLPLSAYQDPLIYHVPCT
jgi:hypothetical protein